MRVRRLFVLAVIIVALAAAMTATRFARRGAPEHDADDTDAPGSVDHWPAVPRKPEG